jgi:hypothetical protein
MGLTGLRTLASQTSVDTERGNSLTTLRIEHPVHDYDQWREAFDRFGEARSNAGVLSFAIRRPVDDPLYVLIDLELPSVPAAHGFVAFLTETVWSNPAASPALAGVPVTRVLEMMPTYAPE